MTKIGAPIPAHSHWDVKHADHSLTFVYAILEATTTAGNTIGWLTLREQDADNFLQLSITRGGYSLRQKVSGVLGGPLPSLLPDPGITLGPHTIAAATLTMTGDVFELTAGAVPIYRWQVSAYPTGANFSYYTAPGWNACWDSAEGQPLDGIGWPHALHEVMQDATAHPSVGGEATFDDPTPAKDGGASNVSGIRRADFGFSHGPAAVFALTLDSPAGAFSFRAPELVGGGTVAYFTDYYRLVFSAEGTVLERRSPALGLSWAGPAAGAGTYTIVTNGPWIVVVKDGVPLIAARDPDGPAGGVRVRVEPQTAAWAWEGRG